MARQINFNGFLIKTFGAYIRTDLSALTDIAGVGTGIIGIMGLSEKGPAYKAVEVNSYTELVETFGDGPLVRHGLAAYIGGASTLVCVRIGSPSHASLSAIDASGGSVGAGDNYAWVASSAGTLGNNTSVSVSYQNTSVPNTEDDDTYLIQIKYVDSRGNDIRETFVFPRYVPNPTYTYTPPGGSPTSQHKYFSTNTTDYYVLRDRESGTIREIPDTWSYGNTLESDFLDKVESLKSTSEDLIGPFPYLDNSTNNVPYPAALIQAVINKGGLGYAPSELVTLEDIDPSMDTLLGGATYDPDNADEIITHDFVALSGGDNGDDGTNFYNTTPGWDFTYNVSNSTVIQDTWGYGLSILEDEEVNFVQPAYLFNFKDGSNTLEWSPRYGFFKALMPLFLEHVTTMSNTPNRRFRTSVVGLPFYRIGNTANRTETEFLEDIQDLSGLINFDRFQVWAGGFYSRAFSSALESYGGDMLASFAVGAHAARQPQVSLTFAQLAGIFTDGLEFAFNSAQKDELYTRSLDFAMKRRTSTGAVEYVAAHNYTSFTGSPSRGLQLFITRRIVDYMNVYLYKNLEEQFVGSVSDPTRTSARIKEYTEALLQNLISDGVLVAVGAVTVTPSDDGTVYNIDYPFQPVSEVDFILVTNHLVYTL